MTEPTDLSASSLAESGAAPVDVDVAAMLKMIQDLQAQVDSMRAAAGIPADPIEAGVVNLRDHVYSRAHAHGDPKKEAFAELVSSVDALQNPPGTQDVELIRAILADMPGFEGDDYVRQLANDLYKLVLKG